MVRLGWRPLALLLVAAVAGCQAGAARGVSGSAGASGSGASASAPSTVGAGPAVSSDAVSSRAGSSHPAVPSQTAASMPPSGELAPVSARARAAGLIDIRTVVADAIIDLRYATSHNFVGVTLYPAGARCLVHRSMAAGLATAADRLRREGDVLVFWDCYRPHAVQVRMFAIVPDPNWVARPGPYARSHEAARSVDVTLAQAATGSSCPASQRVQGHCLLDMGTDFDDFSARAHAFATDGVSPRVQANRALLRTAMKFGGITVYPGEWWHFNGPGSAVDRPQLDAPVD